MSCSGSFHPLNKLKSFKKHLMSAPLPLISLAAAAARLQAGELVAIPTETVYGLAADAQNAQAVAKIFSTKGRPADHPLIVHLASAAAAAHFAADLPPFASALMQAFWPGPLTVIVARREGVASAAAGGLPSVGLRCPSHPVALQLLAACQSVGVQGLAAPSANRFGKVSPTTAQHVANEFGAAVPVLDGGACSVGIESTIVDCTRGQPVILRPGHIGAAQIDAALQQAGLPQRVHAADALLPPAPKAAGTLAAHYAPRAPLRLMQGAMLQTALDVLAEDAQGIAIYSRMVLHSTSPNIIRRRMPDDAQATAQQLFAVLRGFDAQGAKLIWVEEPPLDAAWDGVRDRLQRAAAS